MTNSLACVCREVIVDVNLIITTVARVHFTAKVCLAAEVLPDIDGIFSKILLPDNLFCLSLVEDRDRDDISHWIKMHKVIRLVVRIESVENGTNRIIKIRIVK